MNQILGSDLQTRQNCYGNAVLFQVRSSLADRAQGSGAQEAQGSLPRDLIPGLRFQTNFAREPGFWLPAHHGSWAHPCLHLTARLKLNLPRQGLPHDLQTLVRKQLVVADCAPRRSESLVLQIQLARRHGIGLEEVRLPTFWVGDLVAEANRNLLAAFLRLSTAVIRTLLSHNRVRLAHIIIISHRFTDRLELRADP